MGTHCAFVQLQSTFMFPCHGCTGFLCSRLDRICLHAPYYSCPPSVDEPLHFLKAMLAAGLISSTSALVMAMG